MLVMLALRYEKFSYIIWSTVASKPYFEYAQIFKFLSN